MSLARGASQLPLMALTFALRAWERMHRPREAWSPRSAEAEVEHLAMNAHRAAVATVAAAAPPTASATAEKITQQLDIDPPTSRSDLPIPDFDNVSLGSLRARLRALTLDDLATLREWEQAHAHRLPVLTLLDNRIAKVATPASAPYPVDPQNGA